MPSSQSRRIAVIPASMRRRWSSSDMVSRSRVRAIPTAARAAPAARRRSATPYFLVQLGPWAVAPIFRACSSAAATMRRPSAVAASVIR